MVEVAQHAGVSIATVSRVLNGTAAVKPETAERVRQAVAKLNFYPNGNARALGSGRSGLYGLIISDITNPYFPELVKSFEDVAVLHGQDILIANTNYDPARMEACVMRMLQRRVDGVAIMTSEMDDRLLHSFNARGIPLVFMDSAPGRGIDSVSVDYEAGICAGLDLLFGLGHERIAFLSGPLGLASAKLRERSFRGAMLQHGKPLEERLIVEGDHRAEGGRLAMERVLHSGRPPTAVVASNDLTAIGAMGALHDAGLSIPADVSILGFDDIALSAYTQPSLTTLRVSRQELAATAFASIYQPNPQGRTCSVPGRAHRIGVSLQVRASTGRVKEC